MQVEEKVHVVIRQLESRDKEILRLNTLYEGGQNLDQLKAKYVTDTNNETLSKLQNEIDFVNRENHRIDEELSEAKELLKGSEQFISEKKSLTSSIIDLKNKNLMLVEDMRRLESTIQSLKDGKIGLHAEQSHKKLVDLDELNAEREKIEALNQRIEILLFENSNLRIETDKTSHFKSALSSDKKALIDAMEGMKQEKCELSSKYDEVNANYRALLKEKDILTEEVNTYKSRVMILSRDSNQANMYMQKAGKDGDE
jgi:chromosome segregation ATPase